MKRLKVWLLHNPGLKLISLLLAFFVWLFVVNMSNPKVVGAVTVPFDVVNEKSAISSNELYTLNTNEVNISYDVRDKYKKNVSPESFTAYINLEDYSDTSPSVPVYLETDASISKLITNISIDPSTITVYKEKIQQKKFAVKVDVIGSVRSGYAMDSIVLTPEYIYVKGPLSVIGLISSVGIVIDVEDAAETIEGTTSVVFYDANGTELVGIEDNLSFAGDITYTVPIFRVKTLSVNAFSGGAPASGYAVESVETNPTFISVYGSEEALDQHSYILIPGSDLNISGITENKTFSINAIDYIPEGLKLLEPKTEITILVKVKSIQKDSLAQSSLTPAETKPADAESVEETTAETLEEHMTETVSPHETQIPESLENETAE